MRVQSGNLPVRHRRAARLRRAAAVAAMAILLLVDAQDALADAPLHRPVGWQDWNIDPVLLLALSAMGWLYARGLVAVWDRAGVGRVVSGRQAAAFAAGLLAVAVAVVSPLDPLSDQLAWAHMVQHMILMTVAAPLMVAGAPMFVLLWGLSPGGRKAFARWWKICEAWRFPWRLLWNPLFVWLLYALAMWLWHVPALYQAALRSSLVHDLQHLTFVAAACLFWRVLLDPISRFRMSGALGVLYLFTTTLHATVLGVFMTIAPAPWYDEYVGRAGLWGISALEDQQLAGLIMWMPACAAYVLAAIVLLARCIQEGDERPARFHLDPKSAR